MPLYTYTITCPPAPIPSIFTALAATNCVLSPTPPNGYFLDEDQIAFVWPAGTTDAYMCITRTVKTNTKNVNPFVGWEGQTSFDVLGAISTNPLTIRGTTKAPFTGDWGFALFFIANGIPYYLPDPIIEVKPS